MHTQIFQSEAALQKLVEAFKDKTLPKEAWTHQAHLVVGLSFRLKHSEAETLSLLRVGIKSYNLAVGTANTDSSGYHESITYFWVWVIGQFLKDQDKAQSLDALANALCTSSFAQEELPLQYYSRERLFSKEARLKYIAPDLQSLE